VIGKSYVNVNVPVNEPGKVLTQRPQRRTRVMFLTGLTGFTGFFILKDRKV
jgi:hypothetical protein